MDTMLQFVGLLLKVGEQYSMDVKDLGKLCVKIIVLSLKYVSRKTLWTELFGEDYVDWTLVTADPKRNVLGDCTEWLALLNFCDWASLSKGEATMRMSCPPLFQLRANMKACNLDTGDGDAWTLASKIMILHLVQGLASAYSIEVLTCQTFKVDTHASCIQLMAKQSEALYSPEDYCAALAFMLKHCVVQTSSLDQTLALAKSRMEEHRTSLKLSRMTLIQGRPCLRDRVSSLYKTEERKAQVDTMLQTWDSYIGFCYKHQFATTLSEKVKMKLYFMAAQTRWAWKDHLEKIVEKSGPLLEKVAQHPITIPDVVVLTRVIDALTMEGSAPFVQMTEFRRLCFGGFPVSHVQRMPLSQILKLYVAAYQPETIWKECWKSIVGVISNQIILDVERFVAANPFTEEDVMRHLCQS